MQGVPLYMYVCEQMLQHAGGFASVFMSCMLYIVHAWEDMNNVFLMISFTNMLMDKSELQINQLQQKNIEQVMEVYSFTTSIEPQTRALHLQPLMNGS